MTTWRYHMSQSCCETCSKAMRGNTWSPLPFSSASALSNRQVRPCEWYGLYQIVWEHLYQIMWDDFYHDSDHG